MSPETRDSAQWTDMTGTINDADEKIYSRNTYHEHADPFSDPIHEDEGIQLRDFEAWESLESIPRVLVSEHPSWTASHPTRGRVSHSLKPILLDEEEDGNANSEWETVAADEDVFLKPSIRLKQRVEKARLAFPCHDSTRARLYADHAQRRNTAFIPQTSSRNLVPASSCLFEADSQWQRASSVYEDDNEFRAPTAQHQPQYKHQHQHQQQTIRAEGELCRPMSKKRPATLGFDRNIRGELVPSYSKSSSRASNDPFKFDGADYSPFLKPSAEMEVSRALYRIDSASDAPKSMFSSGAQSRDKTGLHVHLQPEVPVIKRASLTPSSDVHPLSKLDELITAAASDKDAEGDWQTVTTDQAPHGALELTLRLNNDVGSSLADVSDQSNYESFDHFVGEEAGSQHTNHARTGRNPYNSASRARATSSVPSQQPSAYKYNQTQSARAAAAVRRLSRLSAEPSNKPKLSSKLCEMRKPILSYNSFDSDSEKSKFDAIVDDPSPASEPQQQWKHILGQDTPGTGHAAPDTTLHKSRDFAHEAAPTEHSLPRLPFPLISLQEAALLQSLRRERGEEDYAYSAYSAPLFTPKPRSGTISTVSSYGPKTPLSHLGRNSDVSGLAKPPLAYQRYAAMRAVPYEPTRGQLNSSDIIDTHSGSFFRTSLPTNTSLLSARFFRLSDFSARSRTRHTFTRSADAHNLAAHSYFSPSESNLIRSAREDILHRRRQGRRQCQEEDAQQRRIFIAIFFSTVLFPLIGVLALYGKFDATIAWYGKGERGCLTQEQRGTLKQQLWVEGVVYMGLIIALSVYYSVHG